MQARDAKGNDAWVLSYPVKDYDSFHYPRPGEIGSWFGSSSSVHYLGERVSVVSRRSGSAPTLYADLRITIPRQSDLVVENAVGKVHGGGWRARWARLASGDVDLGGFDGKLAVDTGSGDVRVGRLTGAGSIDTGSGDVSVGEDGGLNGSRWSSTPARATSSWAVASSTRWWSRPVRATSASATSTPPASTSTPLLT